LSIFAKPANGKLANRPTYILCRFTFGQLERIGPKLFYDFSELGGVLRKQRALAGGKIIHFSPFTADPDGIQDLTGLRHPSFGHQVAGIKMAFALQAPDHTGAIRAFFHGPQDMDDIDFAGTRNSNDFYVRRIIQSHRTCQVRGGVPSEIAAKCNYNRLKIFAHNFLSLNNLVD
jgi:hypothetical protein